MSAEDRGLLVSMRMKQAYESLADAETLVNGGGSARAVVNRSYYAMFYAVLALLQTIDQVPRKHQGAISLFDTEFVKPALLSRDLSRDLHAAFRSRQEDDYQRMTPVPPEEATQALSAARRFVSSVQSCLEDSGFPGRPGG